MEDNFNLFLLCQTLLVNTNILKLLECHKCGQVCDRYLEVILSSSTDPSYTPMPLCPEIKSAAIQVCGTLVLLDLALQSQPAFRHVLINCGHAGTVLRQELFFIILQHMAESYRICVGCYCVTAKSQVLFFARLGLVTTIVDGYCRWFSSNSGGKFFEQVYMLLVGSKDMQPKCCLSGV